MRKRGGRKGDVTRVLHLLGQLARVGQGPSITQVCPTARGARLVLRYRG